MPSTASANAHARRDPATADSPIYAAAGWPVHMGGHATSDGQLTEVQSQSPRYADADPWAGDRPRLTVATQCHERHVGLLDQLRTAFQNWVGHDNDDARWPEVSRAAVTLWLRARDRERHAAALNAPQSGQTIAVDDTPAQMLTLTGSRGRWVGGISHRDLTIIVAGVTLSRARCSSRRSRPSISWGRSRPTRDPRIRAGRESRHVRARALTDKWGRRLAEPVVADGPPRSLSQFRYPSARHHIGGLSGRSIGLTTRALCHQAVLRYAAISGLTVARR